MCGPGASPWRAQHPDASAALTRWLTDAAVTRRCSSPLAAGPPALRRKVRSLCWMLDLTPPPVLAPCPRKPHAKDYPPERPPGVPEWMRMTPSQLKRWSLAWREWVKLQTS